MRILFLFLVPAAFGQIFSAGIKVGVPVTDPFATARLPFGVQGFGFAQSGSDAKKYLIGPTVELHLPFGFSIDADGLYRPLQLVDVLSPAGQTFGTTTSSASYTSWEVTAALRYRFLHTPIVKPFAEAGPSFRFAGSPIDQ